MYLEMAEGYNLSDYGLSAAPGGYTTNPDVMRNYIFVPDDQGGKWLHISMFDGAGMREFEEFLDAVADYQPVTMREGLSAGGARREFRDQKKQQKLDRAAAKTDVIAARADKKRSTADVRRSKADANDRGEGGKGAAAIGGILTKALDTAGDIFGKDGSPAGADVGKFDVGGNVSFGNQGGTQPEKTFIQKYGLYIAGAAVLAVGIYFVTKKK